MIWGARKGTKSKNFRRRAATKSKRMAKTSDAGGVSALETSTTLHETGLQHRTTDNTSITDNQCVVL